VHPTCRASLGGEFDGYRKVAIELNRSIDDSEEPDEDEIGGQG
jgi:hypothetical protein